MRFTKIVLSLAVTTVLVVIAATAGTARSAATHSNVTTITFWHAYAENASAPDQLEFARIWKDLPKIVFSKTLEKVEGNARLVRDSVADEVVKLKEQPGSDLAVGGAGLASSLIKLNLIDDYRLFVSPIALGGGTPYFPALDERIELELVETRSFASRVVYLRYRRL